MSMKVVASSWYDKKRSTKIVKEIFWMIVYPVFIVSALMSIMLFIIPEVFGRCKMVFLFQLRKLSKYVNADWEGCFGWDQASGYHKVCLRSVEKCVVDKNPLLLSRLSDSGRNSTLSQKYSLGLAGRRHSTITLERKSTFIRHRALIFTHYH